MPPPEPKPAPRVKVTKAELNRRVGEIYGLIASGADRAAIFSKVAKNGWECNQRQIDNYINKARKQMEQDTKAARAEQFALAVAQLSHIQAKAMITGDLNNAIKARAELNKLWSLYLPDGNQPSLQLNITYNAAPYATPVVITGAAHTLSAHNDDDAYDE